MASADYIAALKAACGIECQLCEVGAPIVRDEVRGCAPLYAHTWTDGSRRTCYAQRLRRFMEKTIAAGAVAGGEKA